MAVTDRTSVPPDDFEARKARVDRTTRKVERTVDLGVRPVGITAAARRLDPSDEKDVKSVQSRKQTWQEQGWDVYDEIGEVRRGAQFMGDSISRLQWFVGMRVEPDEDPVTLDTELTMDGIEDPVPVATEQEAAHAQSAFARLRSPEQTTNELLRDAAVNLFQVGEGYLIGVKDDEGVDRFDVYSVSEVEGTAEGVRIRSKPPSRSGSTGPMFVSPTSVASDIEKVDGDAFFMRFWRKHPRFGHLADAAIRPLIVEAEELRVLTRTVMATAMSRLGSKVLVVPTEASMASSDPGKPDDLSAALAEHFSTPVSDPGSAAQVAPFILRVGAEYVDKVQALDLSRDSSQEAEQREELVRRLLTGLDVPVENILGLGDSVTYANAKLVTEQTFDTHLAPLANLVASSFTTGYLIPELRQRGVEAPERFALWYDPSNLIGRPGSEDSTTEAYDRMEASGEYYRNALGIPESAKPTDEEIAERVARQSATAPAPAPAPSVPGSEPEEPGQESPNAGDEIVEETPSLNAAVGHLAQQDVPALVAASEARPGVAKLGGRLARIEADLRVRIQTHLSAAVHRALEKAGAKLVSKLRRDPLLADATRNVPLELVAATVGQAVVAQAGVEEEDTINEVLAAAGLLVLKWIAEAQEQSIQTALEFGDIPDAELERVRAKQEDDRAAGWAWLLSAVAALAVSKLYDPASGEVSPLGEAATAIVPAGMVRSGVSIAGGATGTVTDLAVKGATGGVEGGVATGSTAMDLFREVGLRPFQFVWAVGAPAVPFEPHQERDRMQFSDWEDDRLANADSFPSAAHYHPGDHPGCQCDYEVVFLDEQAAPVAA